MKKTTQTKLKQLQHLLKNLESCAIAYSGGVDSTLLIKVAYDILGENAVAVTATSSIYPQREFIQAQHLAKTIGIKHLCIHLDEQSLKHFSENPSTRCYYCKKGLFIQIKKIAEKYHLNAILDGSNLDDDSDYRPGKKALDELGVISPFKDVGLTKQEIRELSTMMHLETADKPPFACLASRIPYGVKITKKRLEQIEQAESYLFSLDIEQCRVRYHNKTARIEVEPHNFPLVLTHKDEIVKHFKHLGFFYITLDIEGYRTGSLNEVLHEHKKNAPGIQKRKN